MIKLTFLKSIFQRFGLIKDTSALDRAIRILIYILVFLIPLWFLPITVNAVEFNKQVLLVFLITITLILWLVKILSQGELRWRTDILTIFLAVFLVIYILATIFSLRTYGSLIGWPTHLSTSLINILSFLALYVLIVNNFRGLKGIFGLVFAFLISSTIALIIGLIQIWGGFIFPWDFTKIVSFNTVGTINALGLFAATILTLVTALLFVIKRIEIRIFLLVLALLNLIILISINFWILWLVLGVGMVLILVFGLMRVVALEENISWIALPMALLAIALIFMFFRPVLPLRPNLPIEVSLTYKGGWEVIKKALQERPILGTGPETFAINYSKYKPETLNQTLFWNIRFTNPPAEIYSIASDLGILGLIAFLAILVLFIIKAGKRLIKTTVEGDNILKRFLEIGLFSAWLGLMVAWFLYPQNLVLMFVFWLLFSFYLAETGILKEKVYNLRHPVRTLLIASISFVIIVILVVGLLYVEGTRFIAEAKYKRGLDIIQTKGDLDTGIARLLSSTVINPYEDRTYQALAQLFILKINQDANRTDLEQQERLNSIQASAINAINSATQATRLSPQDVSNWLIRGQVYGQVMGFINGADEWAENSYQEAVKLEPANPFIYTEWGNIYLAKADLLSKQTQTDQTIKAQINEDLDKALEKYNQAIALKSDYAQAHFQSALVFDRQGKLAEAISKMELDKQLLPDDSGIAFELGILYLRTKQYQKAKSEFLRAVTLDSNFSNARYFLGLLYDQEGDKNSALEQFEKISELNPDNEEIKQIIANLKAGKSAGVKFPEEIPLEQTPTEETK
jgi:tetratricopeptide (TPR) repeat protein